MSWCQSGWYATPKTHWHTWLQAVTHTWWYKHHPGASSLPDCLCFLPDSPVFVYQTVFPVLTAFSSCRSLPGVSVSKLCHWVLTSILEFTCWWTFMLDYSHGRSLWVFGVCCTGLLRERLFSFILALEYSLGRSLWVYHTILFLKQLISFSLWTGFLFLLIKTLTGKLQICAAFECRIRTLTALPSVQMASLVLKYVASF